MSTSPSTIAAAIARSGPTRRRSTISSRPSATPAADGLLPRDYHHEALLRLRQADGAEHRGALDLLLTDSLVRYLYHQEFGKVAPVRLDADWNLSRRFGDRDPIAFVEDAMRSGNLAGFTSDYLQRSGYYRQLKDLLATYREQAASEGGGYPAVPAGPTLRKGMTDDRIPLLRARLQASEHLPASASTDDRTFDDALEDAVLAFQRDERIDVDGAVGAGTLAPLNVSLQARIDQIRVNLERTRWVFRDVREEDDFVVVNIADFRAYLVRDHATVWETKAQVGRTYRKTPVFEGKIKYAQFNPTWTVPPGILRRDILPKIKADRGYLDEKDMKLVDREGKEVDPASIDWDAVSAGRFPYQVVQRPGPENALGQVKFIFPNPHFVFLHDTPHKEHFDDQVRTFSSGCIRIEKPFEFARLLLDDPQWTDESIADLIEAGQTKTVYLDEPLPVMVLYWTVVFGADGEPRFLPDVYDRDGAVLAALDAGFTVVPFDDFPEGLDAAP
ncbi:MAG: L,D-transpeptidase family protein [Pseudomonadota bacterium]